MKRTWNKHELAYIEQKFRERSPLTEDEWAYLKACAKDNSGLDKNQQTAYVLLRGLAIMRKESDQFLEKPVQVRTVQRRTTHPTQQQGVTGQDATSPPQESPYSGVEGASQRVHRIQEATEQERAYKRTRESMGRMLAGVTPHAFAAMYNVQGCCGSCAHREVCFGDRHAQMKHCFQVDKEQGMIRLRCMEHKEATDRGLEPADVCGGPATCPDYENFSKEDIDGESLGISR